ncbi:MAG: substrate-binding domain-containing protein [Anaerolineae bacterium]|nr:substrate-binding domain-containing protein [Anaerolineae bacterium]
MNRRIAGFVLAMIMLAAGCTPAPLVPTPTAAPTTGEPVRIRVAAPESLEPVMRALLSSYQRSHPGAEIVFVRRADALAGAALAQEGIDLAAVSWLPANLPEGAWVAPFARDGLAIVVNGQNGLPGLTLAQLRMLFQGRVETWEPWGGLPGAPQIVSREDASGDFSLLQSQVMGEFPVTLTALVAPTTEAVLTLVAENQLAVGYVSTARLAEGVRVTPLDGIPPAPEMLAAGVYPLTRDCYLIAAQEPQGALRDYAQWILGSEGQAIVRQLGFVVAQAK